MQNFSLLSAKAVLSLKGIMPFFKRITALRETKINIKAENKKTTLRTIASSCVTCITKVSTRGLLKSLTLHTKGRRGRATGFFNDWLNKHSKIVTDESLIEDIQNYFGV